MCFNPISPELSWPKPPSASPAVLPRPHVGVLCSSLSCWSASCSSSCFCWLCRRSAWSVTVFSPAQKWHCRLSLSQHKSPLRCTYLLVLPMSFMQLLCFFLVILSICPSMCFMVHKLLVYFPQRFLCLRVPSPFSQQFVPSWAYLLAAARQTTQTHSLNLLPLLSPFCNSSGSFSAGFDDFT